MTPPSITDTEAWAVPATDADVRAAAKHLLTACEASVRPEFARVVVDLLRTRDYTRAEWLLAMREVPFRNAYGQGFRLDLVEEVIAESREDRDMIKHRIPEGDLMRICSRHKLSKDAFAVCGFDNRGQPLYRRTA